MAGDWGAEIWADDLICFTVKAGADFIFLRDDYRSFGFQAADKSPICGYHVKKVKVFVVCPEDCSVYSLPDLPGSDDGQRDINMAVVSSGSVIYAFGGRSGRQQVWFFHVTRTDDGFTLVENKYACKQKGKQKASRGQAEGKQRASRGQAEVKQKAWVKAADKNNQWILHSQSLIQPKKRPLGFSHQGKVYVLDSFYYIDQPWSPFGYYAEYEPEEWERKLVRFEALDTENPGRGWRPLENPPDPFGYCFIHGSSTVVSDEQDGAPTAKFYIHGTFFSDYFNQHLFIYDLQDDKWTHLHLDFNTSYMYSYNLKINARAVLPFPVPISNRLLACDVKPTPYHPGKYPRELNTEPKDEIFHFPCTSVRDVVPKNVEFYFPYPEDKDNWPIDWLIGRSLVFWQVFHLGGSKICCLSVHLPFRNNRSAYTQLRVVTFNVTNSPAFASVAADSNYRKPKVCDPPVVFEYLDSKLYHLDNAHPPLPLPCTELMVA